MTATVLLAGILTGGCAELPQNAAAAKPAGPTSADQPSSPASPKPSARDCPSPTPPLSPTWTPSTDAQREAAEEIDRERQEQARQLDPSGTNTPSGPAASEPDHGGSLAVKGDVTAYEPKRGKDGSSLAIPIEITNCGSARAFYKVGITVTGPGGYRAVADMETETTGVYPGTTWPTELTVSDPKHSAPEHPEVEITVDRKEGPVS
ncbi:hypothetical protein ACFVX6_17545 [Streptomyces sp. NPDC058289]|uniref:hypothetical protein n=1 Tax=Streptomyces sp. NPDC058289 TaxID=3346425 RepID=UPI0036ED22CE